MNLHQMMSKAAERYGRKTAIIYGERRLSFADLEESSNKIANALIELGLVKGARVAMLLPNSPEFISIYFGIIKAGGIAVLLEPKYKVSELEAIFGDCSPGIVFTEDSALKSLLPNLSNFESIKHVVNLGLGYQDAAISYDEIVADRSASNRAINIDSDDIAHIAYTSGPSFYPRGVMVSHRCLVEETAISARGFKQTAEDVLMLYALPMHHAFGLVAIMFASIYQGSRVVIVPGTGLSLGACMEAIEREGGTMFMGVPYIFALAIDLALKGGAKNNLSSLRLCASAGAPLPSDIIQKFKQLYGIDIIDFWGLTEATCHVTCPPLDDNVLPGSVGRALPGWEMRIIDDNGIELPVNQKGEVIVRGPIMAGYYKNPEDTAEAIRDGWLYTGDYGKLDDKGNLFLLGRKKEMIIVKGQNIYPSDIEKVLCSHPQIAEAAVVGIPDMLRGERVGAVISLKAGESVVEQEIMQFCRKYLSDYKVPKQIAFMDALPKTATGKIIKQELTLFPV